MMEKNKKQKNPRSNKPLIDLPIVTSSLFQGGSPWPEKSLSFK